MMLKRAGKTVRETVPNETPSGYSERLSTDRSIFDC